MSIPDWLKALGLIALLCIYFYVFFIIVKNIISSLRTKNTSRLVYSIIVAVLCTLICVFILKPWKIIPAIMSLL